MMAADSVVIENGRLMIDGQNIPVASITSVRIRRQYWNLAIIGVLVAMGKFAIDTYSQGLYQGPLNADFAAAWGINLAWLVFILGVGWSLCRPAALIVKTDQGTKTLMVGADATKVSEYAEKLKAAMGATKP